MSFQDLTKKIPPRFLQEYLETVEEAQSVKVSNSRHWMLIQCYAELQYRMYGGTQCPVCRSHVRHVVPVRAEHKDGTVEDFSCLCTRCFEAERAISKVVITHIGSAAVEHYPRAYDLEPEPPRNGTKPSKKNTKAAG